MPNVVRRTAALLATIGSLACSGSAHNRADSSRSARPPSGLAAGDVTAPWMVTPRGGSRTCRHVGEQGRPRRSASRSSCRAKPPPMVNVRTQPGAALPPVSH